MAENKNHIPFTITLLVIGWGLLIVVNALRADWSGPTEVPPGGNPSSFLTSGSNAETKTGPLTISNNFFVTGNVNLGSTSTPTSSRLVISPYTNASIDAGSGFIRTGYIAAHNYDVINKAYLYSSLEASSYWILSTSTNSLYPTSTSWNVGIGTTNPGTAKLAVMGGNVGIGTTSPENSDGWGMVLDVYGSSHAKSIVTAGTIQTGVFSHTSGYYGAPAGGIIGTKSNHPLSFITNATTKMTISSSGNVGIGTTNPGTAKLAVMDGNVGIGTSTPDTKLVVRSANSVIKFFEGNSGATAFPYLQLDNIATGAGKGSVLRFSKNGTNLWGFGSDYKNNGSQDFWIYDYQASKPRLLINSSGNVGIGTTSPSEKLDVNGTVKATGYKAGTETGITTTQTVVSDVRDNSGQMQKKTRLLTFTNGLLTAQGAESDWTNTTDI